MSMAAGLSAGLSSLIYIVMTIWLAYKYIIIYFGG